MRLSIRYKLLLYMLISVVFFTILLIISNTFLVEKYYLERTKRELVSTSDEVENIISDVNYNFQNATLELAANKLEALSQMERLKGQSLLISGVDGNVFYPFQITSMAASFITMPTETMPSAEAEYVMIVQQVVTDAGVLAGEPSENMTVYVNPEASYFEDSYKQVVSKEDDGSAFILADDRNLKVRTLSYQKVLDNGLSIHVSTPMSVISDGIAISNQFSTIIGLITILFTVLWSLFISHRFTKPIKQMNQITSQMRSLDFNEKINTEGNDELSQLAENINELSDKLDGTIAELNIQNQNLTEEVDRERKIDKMRRDFISNVSHELKTPIFLIQGYADGLKSNISKEQNKKEFYCDVIIEEADKMNVIVKDLLSIAKYESDFLEIDQKAFDLTELIGSILDKYHFMAEKKGIQLLFTDEEEQLVNGDAFKIEQVITNYINNAIEYVDEKKIIRIEIEKQFAKSLPHMRSGESVESPPHMRSGESDKIRVCVFNSGEPLLDEEQMMVWDSFYKVDPSRTRSIGGAGLGLSIVKSIMEAHHQAYGTYNCETGVVFWFELNRYTLKQVKE